MSTATTEKPVSPLGIFVAKLTPKPVENPVDIKEVQDESPKTVSATPEKTDGTKAPGTQDTETGRVASEAHAPAAKTATTELKTEDKPKEDMVEAKRLKDTQRSWHEEHKARLRAEADVVEMKAQLGRIEKKIDGTHEEPKSPSPEQATAEADTKGRIRASHHAAVRQYGQDFVMSTVWATDSPYQELQANSPAIRARVMEAEDPVLEAIAVVKEHQDGLKYGRTPEEIRKKMEAELTPKITQDILDGLKSKPGPATKTMGKVRGDTERVSLKNEAPSRLDFRAVFPWGASRA